MSSTRTRTTNATESATENATGRTRTVRGLWAVACAVATVLLGPAAVTASALDQADKAPMHHAVRADQTQAYIPSDTSRRRVAA